MIEKCCECGENPSGPVTILVNINGVRCWVDKNVKIDPGGCCGIGFAIVDIPLTEYGKKNNLSFEKIESLSYKDNLFLLEEATGLKEHEIRKEILNTYEKIGADLRFNRH